MPLPVNEGEWTTIIKAERRLIEIDLRELWQYRDLIKLFVRRDFVAIYKQTILGPLWFILQPLISTAIFTFIFGFVAKIPTDGVPPLLFYLSGIVTWNYFASCVTKTSDVFVANAATFGKVYFPRLSVPLATVITNFFTLLIQFSLFLVFVLFYFYRGANIHPNLSAFYIPMLFLAIGAMGIGFGIIISSITTRYRDLSFLVGFGMQLWMYATPIVYPLSQVPPKWAWVYSLNPMAVMIEAVRYAFLGVGTISSTMMLSSLITTVVIVFIGLALFARIEKTFIDTV